MEKYWTLALGIYQDRDWMKQRDPRSQSDSLVDALAQTHVEIARYGAKPGACICPIFRKANARSAARAAHSSRSWRPGICIQRSNFGCHGCCWNWTSPATPNVADQKGPIPGRSLAPLSGSAAAWVPTFSGLPHVHLWHLLPLPDGIRRWRTSPCELYLICAVL